MDRLTLVYSSSPLLLWVLGSILLYVLATNALWLARSLDLVRSTPSRWLVEVGRFLFFLGVPYLALGGWPRSSFQGLLGLEDLGLAGSGGRWTVSRWLDAVGTGVALGVVAFVILYLAWANANRKNNDSQSSCAPRLRFAPRPWWTLLVEVIYQEVHWAFYRGALAVTLVDFYAGVFWGLGLVYLEWAANPTWRRGWRLEGEAAGRWLRAALALVSASIFFLTRNLWVCLGIHAMLELALWRLGRERVAVPDGPSQAVEF